MNRFAKAWNVLTARSEPRDAVNPSFGFGGASNIFGSIARPGMPFDTNGAFIPMDNEGGVMRLSKGSEPDWMGLETIQMQAFAYDYCSPLAAVIDRLAQADTNGRIEFVDETGATIQNISKIPKKNRIKNLLLKPNPLQTWHEFNNEQVVISKKHGYCPVFVVCPAGMDKTWTKFMINISPEYIIPHQNLEYDLISEYEVDHNPISHWTLSLFGTNYDIPASEVMIIKDGLANDSRLRHLGLPKSKVAGLDYFISNICAAMEADNVLLKKKGPLGVFSYDQKPDLAGYTPMDVDDKDELQEELGRYGLSWNQLQYVISKSPIKWNPMSFNVEELKTKETIRMGIDGICDRLDYPAELMSGKNATYENRNSAEKFLYQNNIIPCSLRRMATYCIFFGIDGLVLDYDHLPVLQEDILHAGQAREALSAALTQDWENGMISYNEYRDELGMDKMPGKDKYFYSDYLTDHTQVKETAKTPSKPKTTLKAA